MAPLSGSKPPRLQETPRHERVSSWCLSWFRGDSGVVRPSSGQLQGGGELRAPGRLGRDGGLPQEPRLGGPARAGAGLSLYLTASPVPQAVTCPQEPQAGTQRENLIRSLTLGSHFTVHKRCPKSPEPRELPPVSPGDRPESQAVTAHVSPEILWRHR